MNDPLGFTCRRNQDGRVVVLHHGRRAASLNKVDSAELLNAISGADPLEVQHILARLTGNYRRGNERAARFHHRNQN